MEIRIEIEEKKIKKKYTHVNPFHIAYFFLKLWCCPVASLKSNVSKKINYLQ